VAVGVVDALEPVEVDQRDRAGRVDAMRAGDFVIQHPHDAAAIERPGQLVELGELLDALVSFLEFEAALVKHVPQRTAIKSEECTLSDREDVAKHRGDAFDMRCDGHADRRAGEEKNRSQTHHRESPGDGCLPGGHPQRAEFEDQEQDAEKSISDFGHRQQEAELERDMAADLKDREIVILEPVVDVGLGQHDKKSYYRDTGQEINRGNEDRDCAGVMINQQDHRN
jgi:hypothetical protein